MPELGGNYEGQSGLLPDGEYVAIISNSEFKQSKNNPENTYLNLTVDIVGTPDGKKFTVPITIWEILNIKHPTLKTRNYAKKTLQTIVDACGLKSASSSEQLHGKPMRVKVIVADGGQWEDKNAIKGWYPLKAKDETKVQAPATPKEPEETFRQEGDEEDFAVEESGWT